MNYFSCVCVLLVAAFGCASAQVIGFGKCPTVTVKADFNILQYLGIWYEIRRYPAVFESGQKCSRAEYTVKPTGGIKANNTATDSKQQTVVAVGNATIPDASVPAKLRVTFGSSPIPAPYWVIDTDYANYAIVYSCTQIAFAKTEFAWILSRTPTLNGALEPGIADILARNNISAKPFSNTLQQSCVNY